VPIKIEENKKLFQVIKKREGKNNIIIGKFVLVWNQLSDEW